ncbi:AMP-binding protein [bacterium]|nr:AMP-binding protein [bacterium]
MPEKKDFFNRNKETIPPEDLETLQLKKLRKAVLYAADRSRFYRRAKKLQKNDARFLTIDDFAKNIPFTEKGDLLDGGIRENLCVPENRVAEVHFSSGTNAKPVFTFLTKKDIDEGNAYLARTWHMQGIRRGETFAMFASYGLFSAGFINHYAIQKIGSFIIPAGNVSSAKALELIREFKPSSSAAVASYYLYLIAEWESAGLDFKKTELRHIIAGGEPFTEKQRRFIEKKLGGRVYDQYGLCEINTGLAGECSEKNGLHILADYVYPEIINPRTGAVLGDDMEGELVLTTFHKEASPLIRYRTGDITRITRKMCPCGRTMPRIARIRRRTMETLFFKGMKIEKKQVEDALSELRGEVNPYLWRMEIQSISGRDRIVCKIVPSKGNAKTLSRAAEYLKKKLGLNVKSILLTKGEIARLKDSKLKHFGDNKKK